MFYLFDFEIRFYYQCVVENMEKIIRFSHTVKTALVQVRIMCLYKEVHHTVRNKGDLDSVIKTKTLILAL